MSEKFAKVNGINICYKVDGKGEPIVLIHGFGSKKEVFIGQIPILSKYFKVITFDNRGSGESSRPSEPFTPEIMAKDTKELLDHLGIDKAYILGYSLGGMIAQMFAITYPDRVNKLILVATTPYIPTDEEAINNYKNGKIEKYHNLLKDPIKTFWDNATPGFSEQFKAELMADPKKKVHGLFSAEDLIEIEKKAPSTPQDIENSINFLRNFDVLKGLSKVQNDTLIIAGTNDETLPKMLSEQLHNRIKNSKLVILDKVGHYLVQEKAPELNESIINFLKK